MKVTFRKRLQPKKLFPIKKKKLHNKIKKFLKKINKQH